MLADRRPDRQALTLPLNRVNSMYLRYLPPYCPQLNPIEGVWRKLKGFLMPRRCYNSLTELNAALKLGLKALNVTYV